MQTFSATQAAVVTGLPLKAVQKAIDAKIVPYRTQRQDGARRRFLLGSSLLCLRLEAEGLGQLPLRLRKQVFSAIVQSPQKSRIRCSDVMWVDVAKARTGLAKGMHALRKAEQMVVSDPDVMGGALVVRGTRVPVYTIADMRATGAPADEILAGYPSITASQLALAELYAQAHPKRGRPIAQTWTNHRPVRRTRKRLRPAA